MIGDLLLTWLSETGTGRIANLKGRASWLARTENMDLPDYAVGRWLRNLSALGHCEVDWETGKWAVAPPTITRLPFADGLAVLTGSRRPRLLRALEDEGAYYETSRRQATAHEIPVPATYFLPFEHEAELKEIAIVLGATYAGCAAKRIAHKLRPSSFKPAAPPSYDSVLERMTEFSPRIWEVSSAQNPNLADSLYRVHANGARRYLLLRDKKWYSTDLARGIFAELERTVVPVIRWRSDGENRPDSGTVFTDWDAPFPPLQARALTLCCGFAPRLGQSAGTVIYDNVPREIALQVARSLGQTLQFEP